MMYRGGAYSLLFVLPLALAAEATASGLPPVKTTSDNAVPACVTPGRLMAFIKTRNEKLDPRFNKIAVDYMRHGERLRLRWDVAFFQMAIETGYLTFDRETGRRADVRPKQNNFAGMGATGNGEAGESFPDVATGVLAHLQHVLLYAGERIDQPVAERTRKVQEWGILKSWQKSQRGPITFAQLARRWANNEDAYPEAIAQHAKRFTDDFCDRPDPSPDLLAEARGQTAVAEAQPAPSTGKGSGATLAKKAIEDAKATAGASRRSALGAGNLAKAVAPKDTAADADKGAVAARPEPKAEAKTHAAIQPKSPPPQVSKAGAAGGLAGLRPKTGGQAPQAQPQPPPAASKVAAAAPPGPATAGACRVWTASYGGARGLIIRSQTDGSTNYTVLDVNEGAERREAEAYIQAYARGGAVVQEFATSAQALERAFDLCPEG